MADIYNEIKKKIEFYEYVLNNIGAGIYINRAEQAIYSNQFGRAFSGIIPQEVSRSGTAKYQWQRCQPDDSQFFEPSKKNRLNKLDGTTTTIWKQKDTQGLWHTMLGTAKTSKWAKDGQPAEVVACAIVLPKKLTDITRGESLLKENKYLKNKIRLKPLTKREKEILKCIAQGKNTRQIAAEKFISFHTVETHRKNILKKLHLKNMAQLVSLAVECGLY